ncbi:MAG: hypothetical protein A3J58_03370 [Candidatus Sungbacteria bacterium RIFCSPHIGHO2_02_FULL_52_23]|uniref:Thioredoxin domain-containing protein n=1 Tax=Candidatus Sungbacteria bacterium RIFCSPHIGHO2_02_FULL_52_23 TaxID=1802274 RepID=A0A1G2KZU9_9BACT|nr:MAG: hypothetical protein A3J58_03370 [Candidatus Sungbacteria bacterium RIFCSPHIGHO2_02_FULL_52_23]
MENESFDEEASSSRGGQSTYVVPGAILIAGVLIAGAVLYTDKSPAPAAGIEAAAIAPQIPAISESMIQALADDDPFLGDPSAPVTVVEFGDFQCPFCGKFFEAAEQDIIKTYVKTGKVKFVFRDFPLNSIHEEAQKSAEAAVCAHEQGQFWKYHDLMFGRQGQLSLKNYKAWAREIGLKTAQFDQCLDSGKYAAEIEKDLQDGIQAGVSGTPATFVNGRLISGAVPFAGQYRDENGIMQPGFQMVIEEALQKAGQ